MSEDWKAGDIAVCVDARVNPSIGRTPLKLYRHYRVEAVFPVEPNSLFGMAAGLLLRGLRSEGWRGGFSAPRFRKLCPADPEFIEQLAATKRPVRAEERIDG